MFKALHNVNAGLCVFKALHNECFVGLSKKTITCVICATTQC